MYAFRHGIRDWHLDQARIPHLDCLAGLCIWRDALKLHIRNPPECSKSPEPNTRVETLTSRDIEGPKRFPSPRPSVLPSLPKIPQHAQRRLLPKTPPSPASARASASSPPRPPHPSGLPSPPGPLLRRAPLCAVPQPSRAAAGIVGSAGGRQLTASPGPGHPAVLHALLGGVGSPARPRPSSCFHYGFVWLKT